MSARNVRTPRREESFLKKRCPSSNSSRATNIPRPTQQQKKVAAATSEKAVPIPAVQHRVRRASLSCRHRIAIASAHSGPSSSPAASSDIQNDQNPPIVDSDEEDDRSGSDAENENNGGPSTTSLARDERSEQIDQMQIHDGPPPTIQMTGPPEFLYLCKSPFAPLRGPTIRFVPADRPWAGHNNSGEDEDTADAGVKSNSKNNGGISGEDTIESPASENSESDLPGNEVSGAGPEDWIAELTALVEDKRLKSSVNNNPVTIVRPHALADGGLIATSSLSSPVPIGAESSKGLMKIALSKNKPYQRLYFIMPDLSVRFSSLMAIFKATGFRELCVSQILQMKNVLKKKEIRSELASLRGLSHAERSAAVQSLARRALVSSPLWSVRWCKRMDYNEYSLMAPHQRVNHFPGTWGIGRKDNLHSHLERAAARYGREAYHFFPEAFLLPQQQEKLRKDMKQRKHCPPGQRRNVYIVKQVASACGRGMHLLQKGGVPKGTWLVQRYVDDPLLIDGFKFDLRIYVAVTSFNPLKIYVYQDGLVRFATSRYPGWQPPNGDGCASAKMSFKVKDVAAHLTNYSINCHSKNFVQPTEGCASQKDEKGKDGDRIGGDGDDPLNNSMNEKESDDDDDDTDAASKWTISTLRRYFENKLGLQWLPIWERIEDVIIKTLISVEPDVNAQMRNLFPSPPLSHPSHPGGAKFDATRAPPSAFTHRAGSGVSNCFELFGFDVLLRQDLSPVLMEVNIMPSLHSRETLLDQRVKANMIADLLTLVGATPYKPRALQKQTACRQKKDVLHAHAGSDKSLVSHSFFSDKTPAEIDVIITSEEENARAQHFKRIFPTNETRHYLNLFPESRLYNNLLADWLSVVE